MVADRRVEALQRWLNSLCCDVAGPLAVASADASARRYFRVPLADGSSAIAMDAPPDREDPAPFLDVAQRLRDAGVNVPDIHAWEPEQGFVLMSDLGSVSYIDRFDDPDQALALMDAAVETLVAMQSRAATTAMAVYDSDRLATELDLFPTWYVRRHLGIEPSAAWWRAWSQLRQCLIEQAVSQPAAFVHRDYMPRNLMVTNPSPGVIDFQDAVQGPLTYDLASLLRDAFVSWSQEHEQRWVRQYRTMAQAAGLPVTVDDDRFQHEWRFMAMQRHLKVLGVFARLRYRDGKPHYLQDASRFWAYLDEQARFLDLVQWPAIVGPLRPEGTH